ncbi:hypothetical protein JTE90_004355 [Oedothorax gibbosus]|uniref:GH18 domain-containing protein n=1 Tax=Oedothorax gibbosus TaxID=931172 RepID=A0AAV6VM00_9ARAC|nr:hypothetical protein JTE90_004355 [Oedothorax gibbosus]
MVGFHAVSWFIVFFIIEQNLIRAQSYASASHPHHRYGIRRTTPSETGEISDPLKGRRIVCVYNNNNYYSSKFQPKMIDSLICTHVNYEFAILDPKTYELVPGEPSLDIQMGFYDDAVGLKNTNPNLKVLLSMGGWKDSTKKYSELVESESRMDNFIEKAVPFLKKHNFDGLDIAWEYPNCWQGDLGVSPKDKPNFAAFLKKLRTKFDTEDLLLSISVGAVRREILAAYEGPTVSSEVDFVNVMTYDMHGPWERRTGHHAQFDRKAIDTDQYLNMKSALEVWTNMGVDKRKLNIGVPTYATTYTLVDARRHGMGAPAKGSGRPGPKSKQGGLLCYNEICQWLNKGNWTEDEDKEHGFYAFSGDQWASYDPPMMLVRKAKWTIENGFGGLLVKDCSCDDYEGICFSMPNPLIKMARMEMVQKVKKLAELN